MEPCGSKSLNAREVGVQKGSTRVGLGGPKRTELAMEEFPLENAVWRAV